MSRIKSEIANLRETDIYSLLLFILYQIKECDEFSPISELVYVLDKDNFLRLCEYFGGMTITIPTIEELESLTQSLLLYQYIKIDHIDENEAINKIKDKCDDTRVIKSNYNRICEILDKYEFKSRTA